MFLLLFTVPPMAITKNDDDSSSHHSEYCSHCQQEFASLQVSCRRRHFRHLLALEGVYFIYFHLSTLFFIFLKALKEHIMQVHQSLADAQASAALNGVAQHFSPPPTFSPGSFPFPLVAGANDNRSNSQSRSPNNNARAYACSYQQCGASFPTGELLDKHEMLQHSSGATSVVSTTFLLFALAIFCSSHFELLCEISIFVLFYTFQQQFLHARYSRENEQACKKEATR